MGILREILNIVYRISTLGGMVWTAFRWATEDGLTQGISLGVPEYAFLMTIFGALFIGINWGWIRLIFASGREAKRYEELSAQFQELAETIELTFGSLNRIFLGFREAKDSRTILRLVNEPAAKPLLRRLRFCQAELSRLGIDSPEMPRKIKDFQTWLEFLRQLKVLAPAGDYRRARSWGEEMTAK